MNQLQQDNNVITFLFGNAYAVKNLCNAKNLIVCYEDDEIIQTAAFEMLIGKLPFRGTLPVSVCERYKYGAGHTGIAYPGSMNINQAGFDMDKINSIDSIANDAIMRSAIPGCVVMVVKDGKIAFQKAYGSYTYDNSEPVKIESVYDMASVTKICATTIAVMKLYDEGKLDLKKKLGDYLPWVTGTNKQNLVIEKFYFTRQDWQHQYPFTRKR